MAPGGQAPAGASDEAIAPFARMALNCVFRTYPNQMALRLEDAGDLRGPAERTPVFYGCYDWHSAVHGHWLLAVASAHAPSVAAECERTLAQSLKPEGLQQEAAFLRAHPAFERPYGLAWLLALDDALEDSHREALAPVTAAARDNLLAWLGKLGFAIRSGTHSQTAFALGLAIDWADRRDAGAARALRLHARRLYARDHTYALHLEPSGEDFLSPSLGAADLMGRVLQGDDYARYVSSLLGDAPSFAPPVPADRTDGRLVHLDGLNLSRAFMLEAIASRLPEGALRTQLEALAQTHAEAGLAAANAAHYAGSHWLGTFAAYLRIARHRLR
ncbi:MAG: DUF2891 family protein [Myxococcota bacterium]